jgi:Holliday junction resolvase
MRESKIERTLCKWAREQGCIVIKQVSPGNRGIPDRLFLKHGRAIFLEFKAPGKQPSKLQEKWIRDLWLNETPSFVCDSVEQGQRLIEIYLIPTVTKP